MNFIAVVSLLGGVLSIYAFWFKKADASTAHPLLRLAGPAVFLFGMYKLFEFGAGLVEGDVASAAVEDDEASIAVATASQVVSKSTTSVQGSDTLTAPQPESWTTSLYERSCQGECCGGSMCSEHSKACASGVTCLPGSCRELLVGSASWHFRLSAIYREKGPVRCSSQADLFLCIETEGNSECVSQADGCEHANGGAPKSSKSISITIDDLLSLKTKFYIREGSESGTIVARGEGSGYSALSRSVVCRGGLVRLASGEFAKFTYFLTPT